MTQTLSDRLVMRAMVLATDAFDDDVAEAKLRQLAGGNIEALDRAISACLAQSASLATRRRAIELLARVRYEDLPPPT
jgi:hypothetical protein